MAEIDDNQKSENDNTIEAIEESKILNKSSKNYLVLIAVVAVIGLFFYSTGPTKLEDAASYCFDGFAFGFDLDEDGKGAYMDGAGEDEIWGMDYYDQKCILEQLDAPNSVFSKIGNTNSLMGVLEADWDNVSISWTYHPDNGLDVSIDLD